MKPLVLPLPGNAALGARLAFSLGAAHVDAEDLALRPPVAGRHVVLVSSLAEADGRTLPLLALARHVRAHGARSVTLVAPDLPERCCEALALVLRARFDAVLTLGEEDEDGAEHRPWLMRVSPVAPIAAALREEVPMPLLAATGDGEPWMEALAVELGSRLRGLRTLADAVQEPNGHGFSHRRPVLLAPRVISETIFDQLATTLRDLGCEEPLAFAIHAGPGNDAAAISSRVQLWTTNSWPDPSNRVDLSGSFAEALRASWASREDVAYERSTTLDRRNAWQEHQDGMTRECVKGV